MIKLQLKVIKIVERNLKSIGILIIWCDSSNLEPIE